MNSTLNARTVIRALTAVAFFLAAIATVVLGFMAPEFFKVFLKSAFFSTLADIWANFVLPNIQIVTIFLGAVQVVAGVGLLMKGQTVRIAAWIAIVYLIFMFFLGCGVETESRLQDFLKNRIYFMGWMTLLFPSTAEDEEQTVPELLADALRNRG